MVIHTNYNRCSTILKFTPRFVCVCLHLNKKNGSGVVADHKAIKDGVRESERSRDGENKSNSFNVFNTIERSLI